jgi:WD40 repeat protein
MSMNISNDKQELIVGTKGGKIYRVLTNDLSFLLHSDAHVSTINDVSFGTDSNSFVTVDEAGAVKMWDLSDYKCLFTGFPTK